MLFEIIYGPTRQLFNIQMAELLYRSLHTRNFHTVKVDHPPYLMPHTAWKTPQQEEEHASTLGQSWSMMHWMHHCFCKISAVYHSGINRNAFPDALFQSFNEHQKINMPLKYFIFMIWALDQCGVATMWQKQDPGLCVLCLMIWSVSTGWQWQSRYFQTYVRLISAEEKCVGI